MGSVLVSERNLVCMYFPEQGNQVRVGWKDSNRCSHKD